MQFPLRVYYEDTDAGGVVYHSNYLNFFERARTEFLRQAGFSQQQLFAENLAFVVKHIDISYHLPARLDDELVVETHILVQKKASVVFSQRLIKAGSCLSEAQVTVASIDLNKMKAVAMPKSIISAFEMLSA